MVRIFFPQSYRTNIIVDVISVMARQAELNSRYIAISTIY